MNSKTANLSVALIAMIGSALTGLQGQVAPPAPASVAAPSPASTDDAKKITLEPAKEDQPNSEESAVVELSPFVVSTDSTQRYQASSTLAGTRVRTDLADIGASISVVTSQFLEDTGSKDAQSLLVYTTNTEVGGLHGNYTGVGNGNALDENSLLVRPNLNTRTRGLSAADNTRDYFLTDIPWDGYNIGRIDMSRGANAVLFGVGSPAGIMNASTNGAEFRDTNKVEWTYGQYNSQRGYLDLNKVILKDELAVRVETLRDNAYYREQPSYKQDKRLYSALRYDPKFLDKNGMHTSLKINFEKGSVNSNNPRMLPPIDKITPWFTAMNKGTYNAINAYATGGAMVGGSAAYQPWLANEGLYGGPIVTFPDPTSSQQQPATIMDSGGNTYYGVGPNGLVDHGIGGLPTRRMVMIGEYSQYSANVGLPFSHTLNPYKNIYIQDPTIYNFYDLLIDGPNKHEWQNFDVVSADLSQTFWKNRLGLQAVWSMEHYNNGQITTLNNQDVAITVDVNQIMPDGSPDPNTGRPMIDSRTAFGNNLYFSKRTASRYTAFADLKASDFLHESWLTKVIGRHVFTAAYTVDKHDSESRSYQRFGMDPSYNVLTGATALNEVEYIGYLGPSLATASTAHGANLSNLQALQLPTATSLRYFNSNWAKPTNSSDPGYVNPGASWVNPVDGSTSTQSENPANYVGWTTTNSGILVADNGATNQLITYARKNRDEIKSKVFVWQGYLFGGDVVPMWSARQDDVRSYSVLPPQFPNNSYNVAGQSYVLPSIPTAQSKGTIHSFGGVVHTPKALRKHLWGDTDLAFIYNKSSNFQDLAGRVDLYGQPVPPPTGKTKDYGVVLTTWNGKLSLKVVHYDSNITNDTGSVANAYVVGYMVYSMNANAKRFQLGLSGAPQYSVANAGYGYMFQPGPGQSAGDALAVQTAAVNAGLANLPSDQFLKAWNIDITKSSDWLGPNYFDLTVPTGLSATQASESKGMEYEVNFQPTKNWSVAMNASHDTAKYTALAANFQAFVNNFNTLMGGPAGDLPLYFYGGYGVYYGRGAPYSLQGAWNSSFYAPYLLTLAQQGTNLPEIRPWHFNLVTNYNLSQYVKGLYAGGGYRWEDKVAIGYPVMHDATLNSDTFDVAHPYWGPKEKHVDLWIGYDHKLTRDISWRIQLNVRDVGVKAHLVPISAQPDGTTAGVRIADGQNVQLTNTFTF